MISYKDSMLLSEEVDASCSVPVLRLRHVRKSYPLIRNAGEAVRYLYRVVRGDSRGFEDLRHVDALRDINITVKPGERIGIVGRNGSGKSTLLNLIRGALPLTSGSMEISGNVYYMGAGSIGLDVELTAREAVSQFLIEHGASNNDLAATVSEIEHFLELGNYFDQPLKSFSLGMKARTEFAAATAVDSNIMLIDEVLGAGDMYWAEKCARRMEKLCQSGRTMLIVSHSLGQILRFCDRVIWLDVGRIVLDGPAQEVVRRYEAFLENLSWKTEDRDDKAFDVRRVAHELGDVLLPKSGALVMRWPGRGSVQFDGIWLNGKSDNELCLSSEETLEVSLSLRAALAGQYALRVVVTLWGGTGKRLGVIENDAIEVEMKEGEELPVRFVVPPGFLGKGDYDLTFSLFGIAGHGTTALECDTRFDVIYKSYRLHVEAPKRGCDISRPDTLFSMPVSCRAMSIENEKPGGSLAQDEA